MYPAVTLSVAKRPGVNASALNELLLEKVEGLKGTLIPHDLNVTVTRNYGETAAEKSNELIKHLILATLAVVLLIGLMLGWKESLVVGIAVPVTLALTLLIYYLSGYTLNRVTLFALIFSIGILVDDAIVVVENIYRHFTMRDGRSLTRKAIEAVDEVGNPTILATFTVIAAILPDGLRARHDGALHAAHSRGRQRRHAHLPRGGLHGQPVGRLPPAQVPRQAPRG